MRLCEALQVRKGEVVSLVGAGGKTTAMYRLGTELAEQGWRVVTTTTTMIRPPSPLQTGALIVEDDPARAAQAAEQALRSEHLITLAARRLATEDKLKGIDPRLVAVLARLADAVVVEADGARGMSLKAPAAHEPVVPAETTLFVPVVGGDAIGCRLGPETVHRPELVARLTGLKPGDVLGPSAIADLLVHPQGALKGAPAHARVVPLINKVHDRSTLDAARQIAARIRGHALLDRVLIGAVAAENPIVECQRRVSAIVLAAGASERFGSPKQLVDIAGVPMITHVLRQVLASSVDETVVVLGCSAEQIAPHIPSGCRVVVNTDWQKGLSSSLQAGLRTMDPKAEAALFVLADQPRLTREGIEHILQAYYGTTRSIVVPMSEGRRGTPALFDRKLFPALCTLRGDVGGREVMAQMPDEILTVDIPSPEMFLDVDTRHDYERFLRQQH
jgi:molybdenum cofactor cytidylyltransferase